MYVGIHACEYMCVCGNINMHIICMHVSTYVYMNVCMYIAACIYVYTYMLYQCIHLGMHIGKHTQ